MAISSKLQVAAELAARRAAERAGRRDGVCAGRAEQNAGAVAVARRRPGNHETGQAAVRSVNAVKSWKTLSSYLKADLGPQPVRPGPLRALRPVSERLPHLSRAGPGDGFAARPHLPDGAGGQRRAHHRPTRAHRAVPGLPRLRIGVPFGRAYGRMVEDARAQIEAQTHRGRLAAGCGDSSSAPAASRGGAHRGRHAALPLRSQRPARRWCAGWVPEAAGPSGRPGAAGAVRRAAVLLQPDRPHVSAAEGERRHRVAFLAGCIANISFRAPERGHRARAAAERLRSGGAGRTGLLRRAARARRDARRGAQTGAPQHRRPGRRRLRRHHHQCGGLRLHPEGVRRTAGRRSRVRGEGAPVSPA